MSKRRGLWLLALPRLCLSLVGVVGSGSRLACGVSLKLCGVPRDGVSNKYLCTIGLILVRMLATSCLVLLRSPTTVLHCPDAWPWRWTCRVGRAEENASAASALSLLGTSCACACAVDPVYRSWPSRHRADGMCCPSAGRRHGLETAAQEQPLTETARLSRPSFVPHTSDSHRSTRRCILSVPILTSLVRFHASARLESPLLYAALPCDA